MNTAESYDIQAEFYDQIYPFLDDSHPEIALYESLIPNSGRFLELGCGTARILAPLIQRMKKLGKLHPSARSIGFDSSSLRILKSGSGFDLILCLCGMSSLGDEQSLISMFRSASALIASDGLIVVETFVPDEVTKSVQANPSIFLPYATDKGLVSFYQIEKNRLISDFWWLTRNEAIRFSEFANLHSRSVLDTAASNAGLMRDQEKSDDVSSQFKKLRGTEIFSFSLYKLGNFGG